MDAKVTAVADSIPIEGREPSALRNIAVAAAIKSGLNWRETISLVDEIERRTGLQIHFVPSEP